MVGERWALEHPASELHVPLGIHGDAARLWTQYRFEKMVAVTMNLTLFRPKSIRFSRFLLFVIPAEKMYKNRSLNAVFKRLTWSFNAAFTGLNPSVGCSGRSLSDKEKALAGTPITKGLHRFSLVEFRGDWEWHVLTFRPLASWVSRQTCFKCPALDRGEPSLLYHNTGAPDECSCGWINQEFSLNEFVTKRLRNNNLCNLVKPKVQIGFYIFNLLSNHRPESIQNKFPHDHLRSTT